MQAIAALLIFGKPELDFNPADRALWLDSSFTAEDEMLAHFEAQTERRVIKTHTPLDGLPFFANCTYLAVYRDPRDVFFSMLNHYGNIKRDMKSDPRGLPLSQSFEYWLAKEFRPDDADAFALEYVTHHLSSFWSYRQLPNVHLFHYADLQRDLHTEMAAVARALRLEVERDLLAALSEAASFDHMKARATRFVPRANGNLWRDPERFLNKGQSGQFRDVLSDTMLADYSARLRGLLSDQQANWLTSGSEPGL